MDNSSRNAASSPVKNHFDAAALLGAWWSSADQGGMTLASLLRQGTSSSGLSSGSKLDHNRQPSPQTRRRMNGSQAPGKMLPPSAHSRSSKHLDLLQDSLILNSVKEKLLGSAKGPPSLSPVAPGSPFLAHGGERLSSEGGSPSRPGITLPLGSLVREKAQAQALKRSRRSRKEAAGLASAAASKLADCLSLKQPHPPPSSSPSCSLPSSSHLSSSSLFPSPAHSSGPSPRHSASPVNLSHPDPVPSAVGLRGDSMPLPLDLCVKRSSAPSATTFLSPDVTLTPLGAPSPGTSSQQHHLPQRHILETLPASLGGKVGGGGSLGSGASMGSASRRRGRRPRDRKSVV